MDNKIVDMTPEEEKRLRQNLRDQNLRMSPDEYLDWVTEFNEMICHRRRPPKSITGEFKL